MQIFEGHSGGASSVVFSPDGLRMASGSDDRTVRVWDVETYQCQYTLEGGRYPFPPCQSLMNVQLY